MRDSIKENFEDLKELVLRQTRQVKKNNYQTAIIAAVTVMFIIAIIGAVVYLARGCGCDDDFCEFEDDFEEDDFEDE